MISLTKVLELRIPGTFEAGIKDHSFFCAFAHLPIISSDFFFHNWKLIRTFHDTQLYKFDF